ncbi:MAG: extracellular solute-binding protein [Aestuariivita sp.]|nr:extracellular solute-binding protein [Aestuariivita sp.]
MYGKPALPYDFSHLPYVNPDAPKGGEITLGNTGSFDSLNPFISKGTPPWQLRFLIYESLMARSYDEPFSLYGLLAESIHTGKNRDWVEFKLRPEATFWDGSKVTAEDVIWSFETLGSKGNLRYRGLWSKIKSIEKTAPHTIRISFKENNRELALIAGLRPILKKNQWKNKGFDRSGLEDIPVGTGAYKPGRFEAGRYVELLRNPNYWGESLPINRGTQNFNKIRIEFYGDQAILFEAFKAGELNIIRESNPEKWNSAYNFPRLLSGDVIKSEIPHSRPSGMTGLVMNTRRLPFSDWRVREAMILAFNFEFINDTITGSKQPRITSYFSNSYLSMKPGRADATVEEFLKPLLPTQFPNVLEGYNLPTSDGTERNRPNLKSAIKLLNKAGWNIQDGLLKNKKGENFKFDLLLRQSEKDFQNIVDIFAKALQRLGINVNIFVIDDAQYNQRIGELDFDMTSFRRDLSLSPGNEQRLYWGSEVAHVQNTRNLMGASSPEIDATITAMLNANTAEEFQTSVRVLDRILMSGRYVIPIWQFGMSRIAHDKNLKFPDKLPIYGDRGWLPHVWWYQENP